MRERQERHHAPARRFRIAGGQQRLPGQPVGRSWEQRVTIDQIEQGHRLAAQAVNDMAIVDDTAMPSLAVAATPVQGQHRALADEAFQPIVVEPHPQPEADQAGGHRVEDLAQHEAAAGGDEHGRLVVIGGPARRQRPQRGALQLHHLAATGVAPADEIGDPSAVGVESVEIGAAAQQQRLLEAPFEVTVLALDGAVLVRHPGVVACRCHLVMGAQRLVAAGLVGAGVIVEVAERGGQAVGPVLGRHAAEGPKRVLQTDGERGEAFAAEHRLGMFPTGVGQGEVVEPVIEPLAGDADPSVAHVGEVRQSLLSGDVVLPEDHLPVGAVFGAPGANPALQAAAQPVPVVIGVAALHFLEQRDRPQAGLGLEHRADLAVPEPVERVATLAARAAVGQLA
jgi:hypothetical protein